MLDSIKGRKAVVTGGSKGIGKGIAQSLADAGARVAVVSRHLEEGKRAAADIGHGTNAIAGDVTDLASMEKAAKAAAEAFGGIDALIRWLELLREFQG